jgi:transcriptional regulator with XRE-family HTH domain
MTTGALHLRNWAVRRFPNTRRLNQDVADHFGWNKSIASAYLNGRRLPELRIALRIQQETGIPVESWVSTAGDDSAHAVPATVNNHNVRNE